MLFNIGSMLVNAAQSREPFCDAARSTRAGWSASPTGLLRPMVRKKLVAIGAGREYGSVYRPALPGVHARRTLPIPRSASLEVTRLMRNCLLRAHPE
jgi:hypothetical protein